MTSEAERSLPWWRRRAPSVGVFCVVVAIMGLTSVWLWNRTSDVLPEVGKDRQGADPWEDPIGIELLDDLQVARIPDCGVAPVVRIELWDEESEPDWSVSGPPTPMASFAIGFTPEGFTADIAYTAPAPDAVQRLVVVRSVKGVAGIRYRDENLKQNTLVAGEPLVRYNSEAWLTAPVCDNSEDDDSTDTTEGGG
jgi:hypothetical protein